MNGSRLRVLTYHRVLPRDRAEEAGTVASATPEVFAAQMRYLARRYRVVPVGEVLDLLDRGRPLPRRSVVLTFDDGYRDFGEVAWPILRRIGLPATLFVPTAFVDDPDRTFWWDRLRRAVARTTRPELRLDGAERLRLHTPAARRDGLRFLLRGLKSIPHDEAIELVDRLCSDLGANGPEEGTFPYDRVHGWDELRELARDGVSVGGHTRTHPALTQLSPERARAEIRGSFQDLERELGQVLPVFAYPFGAHDRAVARTVGEEGVRLAFTCAEGHNLLPGADPLRMKRTGITRRTSIRIFRVRLRGWFSHVDAWRHRGSVPSQPWASLSAPRARSRAP